MRYLYTSAAITLRPARLSAYKKSPPQRLSGTMLLILAPSC